MALVRLCRKHFGITGSGDRLKVEKQVQPRDVTAFLAEYIARVRPPEVSQSKILLQPAPSILRTFLWARPLADPVLNDVVRLSLYSDEVVIVDPFSAHVVNSRRFTPAEMGPMLHPEMWTEGFANHALMICALEDWLKHGLVVLIPEPKNFVNDVPSFYDIALKAMREGRLDIKVGPEGLQDSLEGVALMAANDEELPHLVKQVTADFSDGDRAILIEALREFRRANPTRYAHASRTEGSISGFATGQNLFEAIWIADQIGGYVVPRMANDRMRFRDFSRGDAAKDDADALASAFAGAPLPMLNNVSLSDALDLRKSGRLAKFRTLLRDAWTATSDPDVGAKTVERERHLIDELKTRHREATDEWVGIYKDLGIQTAAALFGGSAVASAIQSTTIPIAAALTWMSKSWWGPARAFRRRPAALLIQLENRSNPNPVRRAIEAIERRV